MKNLFLSLLLVAAATTNAFADSIVSSQKLQLGDSTRLYKSLVVLGHSFQPDANDPSLIIHQTGFSSSDDALKIQCENRVRGVDLGTECEIKIDSTLSKDGVSSHTIGVVGGVYVVNLVSGQDVKALQRSAASPLGYFQSSEKVQAKLPNGNLGTFPRLRIDCKSDAAVCQITLFP